METARAATETDSLKFEEALNRATEGELIQRTDWPRNRFIYFVEPSNVAIEHLRGNAQVAAIFGAFKSNEPFTTAQTVHIEPHFDCFQDGTITVGWRPEAGDRTAEWTIIDTTKA